MAIMTLRIDARLAATIERLAREEGTTKSGLLREAVEVLEHRRRRRMRAEVRPYDLMKKGIGCWINGPSDLSVDTGRKVAEMLLARKRARDLDRRRSLSRPVQPQ